MVATTSYQAGVETSLVQMAYVQEAAWGVTPTAKLQQIRFTGESLRGQKTRQRPDEINPSRVQSAPVTTEESASGGINFALSYGTYDDLLAGLLCNDWATNVLTNGLLFKSFLIEKRFSATQLLQYSGAMVGSGTLDIRRGAFVSGSLNVMAKEEKKAITSASTGGTYTAATTGRVVDPVGGIRDVQIDASAIQAVCNSISLNITNDGAAADYGLGSAAAQGMRMGTFGVSGSVEFYFRDFTLYDRFKAETAGVFSWRTLDAAGNAYKWELPVATMMNPTVNAGGPNQAVMARYDLEGSADTNGVALRITRTPIT
ncbi:phage tail tube protein [Roseomonas sp. BN140053]|uniref:phage tail tube protein n=1 Tax=Roseomonas sp. BN140053 TaxID=3391898 RepID=UPI0039E99CBB